MAKDFKHFVTVAKFHQIWSHWYLGKACVNIIKYSIDYSSFRLIRQSRFNPSLGPAYFPLQSKECMSETCMLLAGLRVHEHWYPLVVETTAKGDIKYLLDSGCGSVGRAVASRAKGPQFESSHWQTFKMDIHLFTFNCIEKTKIKKKRAGMADFLK